jgi:hypothetical protein
MQELKVTVNVVEVANLRLVRVGRGRVWEEKKKDMLPSEGKAAPLVNPV